MRDAPARPGTTLSTRLTISPRSEGPTTTPRGQGHLMIPLPQGYTNDDVPKRSKGGKLCRQQRQTRHNRRVNFHFCCLDTSACAIAPGLLIR